MHIGLIILNHFAYAGDEFIATNRLISRTHLVQVIVSSNTACGQCVLLSNEGKLTDVKYRLYCYISYVLGLSPLD